MCLSGFDWEKFLEIAEYLLEKGCEETQLQVQEAAFRSAISRAYYAAFGVVHEFAKKKGYEFDKHKVHEEARKFLQEKDFDIAQPFSRLRKWRVNSDYDSQKTIVMRQVVEAIKLSKRIIQWVKDREKF